MSDASAIDALEDCELPILFTHRMEDTTVSVDNVYDLYDAADCKKELYVVEGAEHGGNMIADPEEYWDTVFTFVGKHIDAK